MWSRAAAPAPPSRALPAPMCFNSELSGNEVYYITFHLLLVQIMLCRELHYTRFRRGPAQIKGIEKEDLVAQQVPHPPRRRVTPRNQTAVFEP